MSVLVSVRFISCFSSRRRRWHTRHGISSSIFPPTIIAVWRERLHWKNDGPKSPVAETVTLICNCYNKDLRLKVDLKQDFLSPWHVFIKLVVGCAGLIISLYLWKWRDFAYLFHSLLGESKYCVPFSLHRLGRTISFWKKKVNILTEFESLTYL